MKLVKPVAAIGVVFLILSCFVYVKSSPGEQHFFSISPTAAWEMLSSGKDILFIDVRTPQEIAEIAVEGAQPVPMAAILQGHAVLPKDKPIILICAVGGRSYWVGRFLSSRGYSEVYNLSGGIVDWEKEGLPVIRKKP